MVRVPLGFDSDELVVFVLPGVRLLEPRAVRRSRSNYGGPTIRLAKGLSFRLGAGTSQSESSDELRDIDQGTLVLTTKRLVFMGSMRTSNVKLDDIIGIESYTDGIQVHRERKQRAETYVLGQPLQIVEGSGQGLTVFGPMIMGCHQYLLNSFTNTAPPSPGAATGWHSEACLCRALMPPSRVMVVADQRGRSSIRRAEIDHGET